MKVTVPGPFSLGSLMMDDYALEVTGIPPGAYLKDVAYGGQSILHKPLLVAPGAPLRITLARDGGRVAAQVADADGHPLPDAYVVVAPETAATPAMLAEAMVRGTTDIGGGWSSGPVAPGTYRAIASRTLVDKSPESIARLMRWLGQADKIEIAPGAVVSVKLAPVN